MSEDKFDKMFDKILDISERLARIEAMVKETVEDANDTREMLRNHEQRLAELENHKSAVISAKDVVAWLAIAGIMVWEVLAR